MQDPGAYLTGLGISIPSALDPTRPAILDAEHRSFVNHETFFFATVQEKRRFDADPAAGCGALTDPVTRRRFVPGTDAIRVDHGGRPYYFPEASSAEAFRREPDRYAAPDPPMLGENGGAS